MFTKLAYEIVLAKLLQERGFDAAILTRDPAFAGLDPLARFQALARRAAELTGERHLGLIIGDRAELNDFGLFGRAVLNCGTLLESTRFMLRHMWIFQASPRNAAILSTQDGICSLIYRYPPRPPHDPNLVIELFFAGNLARMRELHPASVAHMQLELTYYPDDAPEIYEQILGVPVRFGAAENRLTLPLAIAQARLPAAFIPYSEGYLRQCDLLLSEMRRSGGVEEQVRRVLVLAKGPLPDAPAVARRLNLSERTLRRRLDAEGTSFQQLADDVRHHLAKSYLANTSLSVANIAELMGYHDPSTFRRAFVKWNGRSPSSYRARNP